MGLSLLKSGFRWDIISFSASEEATNSIKWSRKLYYECVDKNIYFELPYSPMIRNSVEKSRNIILTSAAKLPMQLRAPTDVANLTFILGMSENQGKDAVINKCWMLHKSAVGRRMGPFQVRIEKLDSSDDNEDDEESEDEDSDASVSDMEVQ